MIESKEQFKEFRVNNGYTQKEFAAALRLILRIN